jgi:putative transposase
MKRSRFIEQQIAFILRQAEEGTTVEEVCRKARISEATYSNWRKKLAGLMPSEMRLTRRSPSSPSRSTSWGSGRPSSTIPSAPSST